MAALSYRGKVIMITMETGGSKDQSEQSEEQRPAAWPA